MGSPALGIAGSSTSVAPEGRISSWPWHCSCPSWLCSLTASTRLPALPWNCLLLPPLWLGTVRETGLALLGLLQPVVSVYREPQCTEGKLLLSFSLDSAPSRRRVGMVCCAQPRLQGVAGGVAHSRENMVGEWLRWRRGLRPATASACGQRRNETSESLLLAAGLEEGGAGETTRGRPGGSRGLWKQVAAAGMVWMFPTNSFCKLSFKWCILR